MKKKNKMSFAKGDCVVLNHDYNDDITEGDIGKVRDVEGDTVWVEFCNDHGITTAILCLKNTEISHLK